MGNEWVTIKIRKETLERLYNAISVLKEENSDLRDMKLSINYIINRMYDKWIKL